MGKKVPSSVREEHAALIVELQQYEYEYYVLSKPSVSDSFFNARYYRLVQLEEAYPQLVCPESPTQRVGGVVDSEYDKVYHEKPLLSLDKVNNDPEEFLSRFQKICRGRVKNLIVEDKFDGLTTKLVYDNGILIEGSSRGNGLVGEDLTHTVKTIQNVPLQIPFKGRLVVRGETYMLKETFNRINAELEAAGLPPAATSRNLASGSLRQHDPSVCASRDLLFAAYELISIELDGEDLYEKVNQSDSFMLMWLSQVARIPCASFRMFDISSYRGRQDLLNYLKKRTRQYKRGSISYDIDGVVCKLDSIADREELGNGDKYPNWALAYKFEDDTYETTIEDIVLQVSRTRRINPVAVITPVVIDGTEVSRATLNNFDFMKELGIGIGDTITVRKANGVIPNVVENITMSGSYVQPKRCPVCNAKVEKHGAYLYCSDPGCIGAKVNRLAHFCSRDAMDIRGLSYSRLMDLLENNIIKNVWDLYTIQKRRQKIVDLPGWGEKSYMKIFASVDKSRVISMDRFVYALGIPTLGYVSSGYLCEYAGWDMDKLLELPESALLNVHDFGVKTARAVYKGLHSAYVQKVLDKLYYGGEIELIHDEVDLVSHALDGKVFCITGTLSKNRDFFEQFITQHGGVFKDGIHKDTNVLLCGRKAGSKLEAAKSRGIKVISEKELYAMVE